MSRISVTQDPFVNHLRRLDPTPMDWSWPQYGDWPAHWIDHPNRPVDQPSIALFQLNFDLNNEETIRFHITADNRYMLAIDGELVGRGPERGDVLNWYYESHEMTLSAGKHTICALSWWQSNYAPWAQCSYRPGFMFAAEGELGNRLSTGIGDWRVSILEGLEILPSHIIIVTGARVTIDADKFATNWMQGVDDAVPAVKLCPAMCAEWKNEIQPGWLLRPAMLPAMYNQNIALGSVRMAVPTDDAYPVNLDKQDRKLMAQWQSLGDNQTAVVIPANSKQTVLFDLDNYACFYTHLSIDGGKQASICVKTAEALFNKPEGGIKENRDKVDGMYFIGEGDVYIGSGKKVDMHPLWWQAGRYVEVSISTKDEPLTINSITLEESRYPLTPECELQTGYRQLQQAIPLMVRAEQMCMHETYMDCPYYEQFMYVGDTRLEALVTYVLSHDDSLPKKALKIFDQSRRNNGLTQSRYPCRITQIIPTFSLWWVCMANDYMMWRGDEEFTRGLLPGIRAVMDYFRGLVREDGLLSAPNGWNFVDWVDKPKWITGVPFDGDFGTCAPINLQAVLALQAKAGIERYVGDVELAERDERTAKTLMDNIMAMFWDDNRNMLSDDLEHKYFSEHSQSLAIISGLLNADTQHKVADGLLTAPDLARATIYFSHYLFEAYRLIGASKAFASRLEIWNTLKANGFRTTFEEPEPSRSDCHAWGAHPLYHIAATIAGIRPAAPGFKQVIVQPLTYDLSEVDVRIPHPDGWIHVQNSLIELPEGVTGTYIDSFRKINLHSGFNRL